MEFSAFDLLTPDKQRELMIYAEKSNGKAAEQKPTPEPLFVSMDTIAAEKVDWLWPNRVPIGRITLLDGDPGAGKSFLCLAVATAVSLGASLPGSPKFRTPSNVLLLSIEDGFADTVRPRLDSMGADVAKIFIPNPKRGLAPSLLNAGFIETTVKQIGPLLVVIDPIVAFSTKTNKSKDHEVRELLNPLMTIADKHSLACIVVRHFTKNESAKAMYRGSGSIDFMAACRSAFVVAEDGQQEGRRILAHVKNSLGPKQPSLSFFLITAAFDGAKLLRRVDVITQAIKSAEQLKMQPLLETEIIKKLDEMEGSFPPLTGNDHETKTFRAPDVSEFQRSVFYR